MTMDIRAGIQTATQIMISSDIMAAVDERLGADISGPLVGYIVGLSMGGADDAIAGKLWREVEG